MLSSKICQMRHTICNVMQNISHRWKYRLIGSDFQIVPTMFKREDYPWTKHDHVFSKWKVLIGSNDWVDYRKGKDGVTKYRIHNLPDQSCPGLYELGVALIGQDQGRRKLDPNDDVLAAYLGQAENVRSRLQSYGRTGAHLYNNNNSCLFEDIFSKQGSVLYRWTPMGTKREAEETERMLLRIFDYAWNKSANGKRRPSDLLRKLENREFLSKRNFGEIFFHLLGSQVGLSIKDEKASPEKSQTIAGKHVAAVC